MRRSHFRPRSCAVALGAFLCSYLFATEPRPLDVAALEGVHPRLFVRAEDFAHMRDREWDALGQRYRDVLAQTAEAMLEAPPVSRELTGYRMLRESRKALKRITTWALLYRMEGDARYRDRAIVELEHAVAFSDWNPRHFLDVGEMALAVSIGTDWLWDELTPEQRERFLRALREKAIEPSLDESDPLNWWLYYYNNWNPVCHTGLTAAALLLVEDAPALAEQVIRRAMRASDAALESYQPVGAYPEGAAYWDYGTDFSALFFDLIARAFGSPLGLDEDPAFRSSATYRALVVTPTGRFYNYADGYATDNFAFATAWFASRYNDGAALYEMRRGLRSYLDNSKWDPASADHRMLPFLALWYPESGTTEAATAAELPQLWLGSGPNPVAFVREGSGDRNHFFLGFKGNDGSVSHAHLDAGSFILEDEGVRWAIDLDAQNYHSLEQIGLWIWDRRQHSDRWRVFRLGPYSHNLLLIDQRLPDATVKAEITSLTRRGHQIEGVVDLTPVYADQVATYERTFRVHDFQVLEILDVVRGARERTERQGRGPANLRWRMLTRAEVSIEGHEATLREDGKTLKLVVTAPTEGILRAAPLDPPPHFWDEPNPGVTAIDFWCWADDDGDQDLRVLMSTDPAALEAQRAP